MVAPVLNEDNSTSVYLPEGTWYEFNSTTTHSGPTTLSLTNVPLTTTPVYVRPGGIITLGPVIQHTGQMPGGPLEVQVYGGFDGTFALVEDDGESYAYKTGSTRTTAFAWTDATKTLAWTVSGTYAGPEVYTQANVVLITASGTATLQGALGRSGSVTFK